MHVTNATPQMQAFNAPIWLALEDYALQHAREDDMKISVFTGPYFARTIQNVRSADSAGLLEGHRLHSRRDRCQLCATGYEMISGAAAAARGGIRVWQFTSPQLRVATQVPIRRSRARGGIGFGDLPASIRWRAKKSLGGDTLRLPLAPAWKRFASCVDRERCGRKV